MKRDGYHNGPSWCSHCEEFVGMGCDCEEWERDAGGDDSVATEVIAALFHDWQRYLEASGGGPAKVSATEVAAWLRSRVTHWDEVWLRYCDQRTRHCPGGHGEGFDCALCWPSDGDEDGQYGDLR